MAHNKFLPRVLAAAAAMMLLAGCSSKADPRIFSVEPCQYHDLDVLQR